MHSLSGCWWEGMCGLKPAGAHCSLQNPSCLVFILWWTEPGIYSPHADVSNLRHSQFFYALKEKCLCHQLIPSSVDRFFYVKQRPPLCPLCWGGVSFSAAAVLSHCVHSMSLLPIASETSSVTGIYWVSHIIREPRKWWFLPWSQLCVWLTLMMESPVWEEVGRRTNHARLSSLEIILFA